MPKALVADDHQEFRLLMTELLSDEMEIMAVVSDGEELLRALHKNEVDVVVTDYMMPKLNGLQALSEARAHGRKMPFIIVSTGSLPTPELLRLGVSAFVDKHALGRDLLRAVRRALAYTATGVNAPEGEMPQVALQSAS